MMVGGHTKENVFLAVGQSVALGERSTQATNVTVLISPFCSVNQGLFPETLVLEWQVLNPNTSGAFWFAHHTIPVIKHSMVPGSLPKRTALPNPVFHSSSYGVPWWVVFHETASPFYIVTVTKLSQQTFTSLLIQRDSSAILPHSLEHCHWYIPKTRATTMWTMTSECLEIAVEAFLNVPLGSFWHPQTTPSQKAEQSPTTSDLSCRSCGLDGICILFYGSSIPVSDELARGGEGL